MTARAAVQSILVGDTGAGPETLKSLGFTTVIAANAVDTPPADRFIIVKWLDSPTQFKRKTKDALQIWCHDTDRDYSQINLALQRIGDLFENAIHVAGEDGWTLTLAEFLGEGPDLYDPGYETCTRYADFTAVSRYTPSG